MKPLPSTRRRAGSLAMVVLALANSLVLPIPVYSCDDTILTLISGQNPTDEFSGALLSMVRNLQSMASALTAYDEESARRFMETSMAGWLEFTVRYRSSPPPRWDKDPRWISRIDQVSELLGKLRRHFASGRPQASHDMIEGITTQMTLLGTRATGNEGYDPVLEAEWELLGLNPSLPENAAGTALQARLASFSTTIRHVVPARHPDLVAAHAAVTKAIVAFRQVCEESSVTNAPRPIRAYAELLAAFTAMRSRLLADTPDAATAPTSLPGQ